MRLPRSDGKCLPSRRKIWEGCRALTASTLSRIAIGSRRCRPCATSALTSFGRQLPPKPQPAMRNETAWSHPLAVHHRAQVAAEVQSAHHLDAVDAADRCAEVRELVRERDQRRQHRVRGVLDHFGGRVVGAQARRVVEANAEPLRRQIRTKNALFRLAHRHHRLAQLSKSPRSLTQVGWYTPPRRPRPPCPEDEGDETPALVVAGARGRLVPRAPPSRASADRDPQHPARAAARRRRGAVEAADPARGDTRGRHRRAAPGTGRHRCRRQSDQGRQGRGSARRADRRGEAPQARGRRSRARPRRAVRAAGLRRPARAHGRLRAGHARRVRAEAVDGARHHDGLRSGQRERPRLHGRAQEGRATPTRSPHPA